MTNTSYGAQSRHPGLVRYLQSLKYALHVIVRPFDGFWDLSREKRGSLAAANTIILLALITRVLKLQYTSFQFIVVHWATVNVLREMLYKAHIYDEREMELLPDLIAEYATKLRLAGDVE